MRFTLYSYPDCASHVVRMALEELDVPYRDEVVDMQADAHHNPAFLQINPRGMVPALADETTGAVLSETGAILHYLADQTGRLAPPVTEARARAAFLQQLYFLANTVHADAQLQYYTARYIGEDLADAARPKIHARMREHFALLDAAIAASGGPWLLGTSLSMCDFYVGGCARWAQIAPRHAPLEPDAVRGRPHLNALLERLEALPSVARAFDAEDTPRSAYFRAPVRSLRTAALTA